MGELMGQVSHDSSSFRWSAGLQPPILKYDQLHRLDCRPVRRATTRYSIIRVRIAEGLAATTEIFAGSFIDRITSPGERGESASICPS